MLSILNSLLNITKRHITGNSWKGNSWRETHESWAVCAMVTRMTTKVWGGMVWRSTQQRKNLSQCEEGKFPRSMHTSKLYHLKMVQIYYLRSLQQQITPNSLLNLLFTVNITSTDIFLVQFTLLISQHSHSCTYLEEVPFTESL